MCIRDRSKGKVVTDSIFYPGDPNAPGRMVYNCRCHQLSHLIDYPRKKMKRRVAETGELIDDMTYMEWMKWKEGKHGK